MRTKVADLTQVETESARLYAVLKASLENALQNLGSMPHNAGGKREWHRRSIGRDQNHGTWACSRKQRKSLWRFLDWSFIERAAQEQSGNRSEHSTSRKPENSFVYCTNSTNREAITPDEPRF